MGVFDPHAGYGWFYKNMYPNYVGFNVKPALLGVGFIVGPQIAFVLFLGAMTNSLFIIPLSAYLNGRWDE